MFLKHFSQSQPMIGKKGMSPLIATILLMAFAVALGAVIMNWSTKLPEGGPDCSTIEVNIREFCIADGILKIELRNTGETSIGEVALSVSDPPIDIPHMTIKNSQLGVGQTLTTEIPFGFSTAASVGIVPSPESNGAATSCSEPVHTFAQGIPNC